MNNFSWSTIPLGTYAAIDALSRSESNPLANDVSMLSLITGKPEEYYTEQIHTKQLAAERKKLHDFLNTEINEHYYPTFKCNGRKYKVSESMEEFNVAQLEGISGLGLTEENFAAKSPIAMAILCKEKRTWKFWRKPLSLTERSNDFEKHLPTSIGMGIVRFFFLYSKELLPIVLEKINKETLRMKEQLSRSSESKK